MFNGGSVICKYFDGSHLILQGFMEFWENAEEDEPKTMGIRVTSEMSPRDLVTTILQGKKKP